MSASTVPSSSEARLNLTGQGFASEDPGHCSNTVEFKMNIRLFSASAAASLGLVVSNGAQAWTVVRTAYVAPVVVYAPPPRPVYYTVPVVQTAPAVMFVPAPVPTVYVQAPQSAPTVYVSAPKPATTASASEAKPTSTAYAPVTSSYAAMPAANVSYAQPVATVPAAGNH
jgi:hypothetical protein